MVKRMSSRKLLLFMYHSRMFDLYSCPFLWKRMLKLVSRETFLSLPGPIIFDIINEFPTNLIYVEKIIDDTKFYIMLKALVKIRPNYVNYIIDPPDELYYIAIETHPFIVAVMNNPSEDMIIFSLKCRWKYTFYDHLKSNISFTDSIEKKIRKLKLEYGLME